MSVCLCDFYRFSWETAHASEECMQESIWISSKQTVCRVQSTSFDVVNCTVVQLTAPVAIQIGNWKRRFLQDQ